MSGNPVKSDKRTGSDRIIGLDAVRYIGFIGAVLLHSIYSLPSVGPVGEIIGQAARFAVPYFFIVSGMFLGRGAPAGQLLRRLLIPFAFWAPLYTIVSGDSLRDILHPMYILRILIDGGRGFHLWFLPALALCSLIVLVLKNRPRLLLFVAAALYVFGLACGSYYRLFWGGSHFLINTRDGPFFGLVFTALGLVLAKRRVNPAMGVCLVIFGLVLQAIEISGLQAVHAYDPMRKDFFLGTLPLGVGAFFLARSLPHKWLIVKLAQLGRYTLGFYCAHLLILWALIFLFHPSTLAEALMLAMDTVLLTTIAVLVAVRVKWFWPVLR
jgi:surface polysaccharide O-acyltransferase-like enzyme